MENLWLYILTIILFAIETLDALLAYFFAGSINNQFQMPCNVIMAQLKDANSKYEIAKFNLKKGDCEPTHIGDIKCQKSNDDLEALDELTYSRTGKSYMSISNDKWAIKKTEDNTSTDTTPLLPSFDLENSGYMHAVTTKLGNKNITNLQYTALSLSCMSLISALLSVGKFFNLTKGILNDMVFNFVLAILLFVIIVKLIHLCIHRKMAIPIIINISDSMLDRNNIWHRPIWVTHQTNPKKKRWEEDPNYGIQYSQACEHANDAYSYMDVSNSALIASIATCTALAIALIITLSANMADEAKLETTILTGLFVLLGGSAGTIIASIVNHAAALNSALRSRSILKCINKGFEATNEKYIKIYMFGLYNNNMSSKLCGWEFTSYILFILTWILNCFLLYTATSNELYDLGYMTDNDKFESISVNPVRTYTPWLYRTLQSNRYNQSYNNQSHNNAADVEMATTSNKDKKLCD